MHAKEIKFEICLLGPAEVQPAEKEMSNWTEIGSKSPQAT